MALVSTLILPGQFLPVPPYQKSDFSSHALSERQQRTWPPTPAVIAAGSPQRATSKANQQLLHVDWARPAVTLARKRGFAEYLTN